VTGIECIWPAETILGEAPIWHADEACLYWVDIDGRKVMRIDPASGTRQGFDLEHEIGCLVPRHGGGFVAGLAAGLAYVDEAFAEIEIFAAPEADRPGTRINDGKCDRSGRFWVSSADRKEAEPLGALYCLNGTGELIRTVSGVVTGNGMSWSPDNRTMYFTDTGVGAIYAFDYDIDAGDICNRRIFTTVYESEGLPDGCTVDAEGFIWSAHWGGWRITRYDPGGGVDRVVEMPVPNVTSLAFGGTGLDRLFVTTARLGMTDQEIEDAPLSGGLFALDVGVRGLPEMPYAG
jgi:sugar lactone lactonase YvrE